MNAIRSVRNRRAEMNVPPSKKAALYICAEHPEVFAEGTGFMQRLAYADEVHLLDAEPTNIDGMVCCTTADAKLYIPMGQLVDVEKEIVRIEKELEKANKNLAGIQGKLSNEKFISRAPESVVAAEREKADTAAKLIAQLNESLTALKKL
jgi:valyl-tRNA synthetase